MWGACAVSLKVFQTAAMKHSLKIVLIVSNCVYTLSVLEFFFHKRKFSFPIIVWGSCHSFPNREFV